MATESYPSVDPPVAKSPSIETLAKSESSEMAPPPPTIRNAILISHNGKEAAVDISAAVTVDDVKNTLLTIFELNRNARITVKRVVDNAVVVPGPKLPPGEYIIEELDAPIKAAYKTFVEKHIPEAHQQLTEKHIPFLITNTRSSAEKLRGVALVAHQKAGDGLSVAGTHVSKGLAVAGTHISQGFAATSSQVSRGISTAGTHLNAAGKQVSRGLATAGTHVGQAWNTVGSQVRGQVSRATTVVNNHAIRNSHTWTAQLWSSVVRCAPGPLAWATGVPLEELLRTQPEPLPSTEPESSDVPLSKPAAS